MEVDDRFASRARSVGEVPEPIGGALREHLSSRDTVSLLAFSPSSESQGVRSPATLLALADRRWLVIADDAEGGTDVAESSYEDTLLIELTEILLYGRLKIDFVAGGIPRACAVEFNTVGAELYREAVRIILRGIEGESSEGRPAGPGAGPAIEAWPIRDRTAVAEALPEGRDVRAAARWPAIYGGFGRELAPAAALVATDRELVLISDERAWVRGASLAKYGHVATYYPLVRLARSDVSRHERLGVLNLEMHARHGGESLRVLFPPEQGEEVSRVLGYALGRSSFAPPTSGSP